MSTLLESREPAAEQVQLQEKIADLQQRLRSLLENTSLRLVLAELHDEQNGRVDAQKVADYLGVPLKRLAEGLSLTYKTVHRNPSAEAIQEALRPVKRALDILADFFGPPARVRAWLNTPHPDLGGLTALETILENRAEAVCTILENALAGVPV
ncbi:MAG: DUF2384 domain-containing protein [Rhodospirillales bacterium]|nr:DUF2384 domain-containing protein [Acetobacter sp.]